MESPNLSLLRRIHHLQPVTRRELGERAGLSAARVSALVGQLLASGLVREEALPGGTPGRPASALQVNPSAGQVVGLDIGGGQSRAALCDLSGGVITAVARPTHVVCDRAAILEAIVALTAEACAAGGAQPADLVALGVGLQGIVDMRTGIVLGWPNTPGWAAAWAGWDVARDLAACLGSDLPVTVDDSVRAMGLAAHRAGPARSCPNFLYVYLGDGVGSALLLDGCPYRSTTGLAGELGHISMQEDGPSCSCGNRGCLEVLASTPAVLRRVQERLAESWLVSTLRQAHERKELSLAALLEAARAGDKLAFQVLDEAGTHVGKAIAIALNLTGSELVVLGGPLVQDGGIILDAVQRQARLRALEHITRQVRMVYDDQGEMAGARGAALMALDALFDSPALLASLLPSQPGR